MTQLGAGAAQVTLELSGIFFGMGSLLFFYLFFVGRLIPRVLSLFGVAASVLIPLVCLVKLIVPRYSEAADYGWLPMGWLRSALEFGCW